MLRCRLIALASILALAVPVATAGSAAPAPEILASNPFLHASRLPFQAPPFATIRDSDYQPAIEEGMRQQRLNIERIANNRAAPTFANTHLALEQSGLMLDRVMQVFGAVTSANTNPVLQAIQEIEAPKLAAQRDAIYLNARLFLRVAAIYRQRGRLALDAESQRLIEVVYKDFTHAGAELSVADQNQLKALNQEESTLSTVFTNLLLAATKAAAPVFDDPARLAGLSEAELAAAAHTATERGLPGKYVLALQNTTQQPELRELSLRATRELLFEASWHRAEQGDANDTRQIIARIAQIRAAQARLLGFTSYAAWKLDDQMARTPAAARAFMQQLVPAAVARAGREAQTIQARIDQDQAALRQPGFTLAPWDWQYYAEQVRKAEYDLDENQLKPYFELNNVLQNGVFYAAHRLYGLRFTERHDIPVYQADVRVFEVRDQNGQALALFYCDYFKRDNKNGGAWMSNLVKQSHLLGTKPVIYNVTNFSKPAPGQPAQLSFDDVITLFHEFGHALHGMLADQRYPTLSGTSTARDFVEFPSQFNEHWATDPAIFSHYAIDVKSGAPMPPALREKMRRAASFNQGFNMTELSAAALLDLDWHTLGPDAGLQNAASFESAALKQNKLELSAVPPRYRSSYFQHIWGNGYAAGYYAYPWTQMLADDSFDWFTAHGGLTRANGMRFRRMVLSRGNSEDLARMYLHWRGQAPAIAPMLKQRGLQEAPGVN